MMNTANIVMKADQEKSRSTFFFSLIFRRSVLEILSGEWFNNSVKEIGTLTKKRFSYSDVIEPGEDYVSLGQQLDQLTAAGIIRPILRSGKVSARPYFYREYYVNEQTPDIREYKAEINRLAPSLIEYYLNHEEHYLQDRSVLEQLSRWLKTGGEQCECSVKERSYEIFRDEKKLEGSDCRRVMGRCGMTFESLNCYRTYEPFFHRQTAEQGCVLVLENKDPWYSIDRAMTAKQSDCFLGKQIMYLVYGEGRKADAKEEGSRLQDYLFSLNREITEVLYCGDIDRAGIAIFTGCREVNPDLHLQPFIPLYNAMVKKAKDDVCDNEPSQDSATKKYDEAFADLLEQPEYVKAVLKENRRIPQEILHYGDYLNMCGVCDE